MPKLRRFRPLALALLLCGLTLGARAEATYLDPIFANAWFQPNLEFGNGNKIAVGRFNNIHATFVYNYPQGPVSEIIYAYFDQASATWIDQFVSWDSISSMPTLAVDSYGMPAIAWVSKPANDPLGSIWYSYQTVTNCPTCWSQPRKIAYFGIEPSIAIENGNVHLTWTTRDRVQYTSFPRTAPPTTPLFLGEVVESTNCANTRFHKPSIALAHPPCGTLTVKIASLLTANEQSSPGSCQSADTQVGPRVAERNSTTQVWSTVFQEVVSDPTPNQPDPEAHSISLNANRATGDFYLAWSDEQDQAARTRVAHGNGANWDASQLIDNQSHHVHVAAKPGGYLGHFRLAVSDTGWSTSAYTQTGKWSGGSLSWTSSTAAVSDSSYGLTGHAQALYWRRCASSQLTERKVYTEASDWSPQAPPTEVAVDFTQTGPVNCFLLPVGNAIVLSNCWQTHVQIGQMAAVGTGGAGAVLVDVGEGARVTKLSESGAEITTLGGKIIRATWTPGSVISSWETGFSVATRRDSVRFSGADANYTVEDVGTLGGK